MHSYDNATGELCHRTSVRLRLARLGLFMAVLWVGFSAGFYYGTGTMPTLYSSESAMVPQIAVETTAQEVTDTVAPMRDKEYGEGYNCVDFAWEAMRLLQWQGIRATIVRIVLDPGPDHALLLVPTEDRGWIFVEPQTGEEVKLRVGGKWAGLQTITGVYVMHVEWRPLADYEADQGDNEI